MISKGGLGDAGSEKVRGTQRSSGHWRGSVGSDVEVCCSLGRLCSVETVFITQLGLTLALNSCSHRYRNYRCCAIMAGSGSRAGILRVGWGAQADGGWAAPDTETGGFC